MYWTFNDKYASLSCLLNTTPTFHSATLTCGGALMLSSSLSPVVFRYNGDVPWFGSQCSATEIELRQTSPIKNKQNSVFDGNFFTLRFPSILLQKPSVQRVRYTERLHYFLAEPDIIFCEARTASLHKI